MNFVFINLFTRLFYLLSLFVVYLINAPILYFYILFFFVSVEILLRKKSKSDTRVFKISQLIFTLFVSYVLFVRSHVFGFSNETECNLNTMEHLLFSLVICLLIYYYISFFCQNKIGKPVLFSVLIFNVIGLINEFFQNYFQGKGIFILDEFSIKDLIVNAIGSMIFIVIIKFFATRILVLNSLEK